MVCCAARTALGLAVMERGRRQQAPAPVVMLVALPMEELAVAFQTVPEAAEAVGRLRPVLQCLEPALPDRGVVGDVRPTVGLGDSQRFPDLGDRLRAYRRPPIAVDGQLVPGGGDSLPAPSPAVHASCTHRLPKVAYCFLFVPKVE